MPIIKFRKAKVESQNEKRMIWTFFKKISLFTRRALTDKAVQNQDKGGVPGVLPCHDILDSVLEPKQP